MAEQQIQPYDDADVTGWAADVESAARTLPDSGEAFDALARAIDARVSEFHDVASHAATELEARHAAAQESQETLTKAYHDVQASLKAAGDRCQQSCDDLGERFETLEASITDAGTQIDKWEAECGQALDAYTEAMHTVRAALEATDDEIESELAAVLRDAEERASTAVAAVTSATGVVTEFATHLDEQVGRLEDALTSVTSATNDSDHKFDQETRDRHDLTLASMTTQLQEHPLQALGDWDARAASALTGLGDDVTSTVDQFDSTVGRLLEPVAPILDTVENIKPVLDACKALL